MYGDVTALNAYYTDVINESDALIAKAKSDLAQYEAKKAEQEEQRKRDLQKAEAEQQKSTESDPVKE
jgi:ATPase subunit of ABC transporter with duplicated ATPase domains